MCQASHRTYVNASTCIGSQTIFPQFLNFPPPMGDLENTMEPGTILKSCESYFLIMVHVWWEGGYKLLVAFLRPLDY